MTKTKKSYVLGMFPYPSGEGLHVGHVRIYTACDVMARYFRMQGGGQVLSPMGWDAFGLPAENAAIKFKKNPIDMVPVNYHNFRRQMQDLSLSFDWEHEFATTDPTYYGLTQWLFLKIYNQKDHNGKRLVYREEVPINWCPKCLTGLANEEVLPDGTHERCGTLTVKKLMPQWVMRITSYADRLLSDLGKKDSTEELDWPRGILEMQRNWIGKKAGARVTFAMAKEMPFAKTVDVFTTRIDTIYGVTFLVISPEKAQEWIAAGWQANKAVQAYAAESLAKSEQTRLGEAGEKTGVDTELSVVNPANGKVVPVWVADYVLSGFGTGAVMGVPAHDDRDLAFATKFQLPIKKIEFDETAFATLEKQGVAKKETTYHLRDWVFSRQRYWGEPIPLVYCKKCGDENGVVPLTEKDLPLELPYLKSYEPTETGESPLSRVTDWVNTTCPHCGAPARRETDTMPNWAGSCWYFLAFPWWSEEIAKQLDAYKKKSAIPYSDFWKDIAKPAIDKWLPVDWYLGGAEHAVLHLLYARFWVKVFQDQGLVDFPEPFLRLRSVGLVLAEDGKKMSKSIGNVVNPDDMIAEFGTDPVRLYEMFMGPWNQAIAWETRTLVGLKRFLEKIEKLFGEPKKIGATSSPELAAKLAKLLAQVEHGITEQKFNTAIAGCMEFSNLWRESDLVLSREHAKMFVQILSPFAPQMAQKLWEEIGEAEQVAESKWPQLTGIEVGDVMVTIAVQVNGKLRGTIEVPSAKAKDQEFVVTEALSNESVKKWLTSEIKKTIFVPGKLVSFVV